MLFPGFPWVATAVGLLALIWLIVYLQSKGQPVVFDPEGKQANMASLARGCFPCTWILRNLSWVWQPGRSSCLSAR
jgi:hypothetical protein